MSTARFLHVTDTHLSEGAKSDQLDVKLEVPGIEDPTKIDLLKVTAEHLAERLRSECHKLDGVLFTGDAQDKGRPKGHAQLHQVLETALGSVMHSHARFVATPGNHDVPKGSSPGSKKRYREFLKTWRAVGSKAITPWLDDIDDIQVSIEAALDAHCFADPQGNWAIYPLNSSNWSHTQIKIPKSIEEGLVELRAAIGELDDEKIAAIDKIIKEKIRAPIEEQMNFDIAHVSVRQLEAMKRIVLASEKPGKTPVRIVLLHHHLIAPSLRGEIRPFADITSLSELRTYLRQNEIDVVIHGHKHVDAISYDSVYDHDPNHHSDPRRLLVLSGGTFDGPNERSSMSLIEISGLPGAPNVEVERVPLGRRGLNLKRAPRRSMRLWQTNEQVPGGPVVIHGKNIDEVYARAVEAASKEADQAMLIVHLDLPEPRLNGGEELESLPFPTLYPNMEAEGDGDRRKTADWVKDLAAWWQLSRSNLESRIPYIHGTRLRRFANQFDQIKRIVALLKSSGNTSKAVAVLVDPLRDFHAQGQGEEFASFCLVQFRRRRDRESNHLDCTAYYRAQEFKHWWPINVAELRILQIEVAKQVGCIPGRITTIAADARATATRSPGQVAIPVIDRWLDRSPEKIVVLACYLCGDTRPDSDGPVLDEWRSYLRAQIVSTEAELFNDDGSPVAVNSLEVLALQMESHSTPGDGARETIKRLRRLARENRTYEASKKDRSAFNNWGLGARPLCEELLKSASGIGVRKGAAAEAADV